MFILYEITTNLHLQIPCIVSRTAIITGGTSGIGFYSAIGIAKAGFRVIITGRNVTKFSRLLYSFTRVNS